MAFILTLLFIFHLLCMSEVSISLLMCCSSGVSQQIGVFNIIRTPPRAEILAVKVSTVRAGTIEHHYSIPHHIWERGKAKLTNFTHEWLVKSHFNEQFLLKLRKNIAKDAVTKPLKFGTCLSTGNIVLLDQSL